MDELDLDRTIERYHQALDEFVKGNPEPVIQLMSQRDDVSLANPLGPTVVGWKQVVEAGKRAASLVQEGRPMQIETIVKVVTPELAFTVHTERTSTKISGSQDFAPFELRVTTIFRLEDGTWKIVHRHADPITTPQPIESILKK